MYLIIHSIENTKNTPLFAVMLIYWTFISSYTHSKTREVLLIHFCTVVQTKCTKYKDSSLSTVVNCENEMPFHFQFNI